MTPPEGTRSDVRLGADMTGRLAAAVPGQRGRVDSPFFRSKFRVPAAPQHFVHRARLIELLDDLAAYPVTAVVAPPGRARPRWPPTGSAHCDRPSAWLAIDESDRDPAQFCVRAHLGPGVRSPRVSRTGPRARHGRRRTRGRDPGADATTSSMADGDDGGARPGRPAPHRRQRARPVHAGRLRRAQAGLAPPPPPQPPAPGPAGRPAARVRVSWPTSASTP